MPSQGEELPTAAWLAMARVSDLWPQPADLTSPTSSALSILSATEYERLGGITAPKRRAQFIAGRLLLRRLLEHVLPHARGFSISASDQGPPRLEEQLPGVPALHLALSHSGDWVCAAVSPLALGLDLETTEGRSRIRDWAALAELAACPAEQRDLAALTTPAEQGRFFLRLWTLKEAWFKQQAHALDTALLPRLHTAPGIDTTTFNAWVWQHEHCTLALTWSPINSPVPLPVRWVYVRATGTEHRTASMDTPQVPSFLPQLARQTPQPWHVGLTPLT